MLQKSNLFCRVFISYKENPAKMLYYNKNEKKKGIQQQPNNNRLLAAAEWYEGCLKMALDEYQLAI